MPMTKSEMEEHNSLYARHLRAALKHLAERAYYSAIEAAVSSPVIDLNAFRGPGRLLWARASSACGSVAHGRHLR
jgi:hypothetical protein